MTTILSDINDKIYAYCEWWVTDGNNRFGGEYLYIRDLWIHPDYENNKEILKIIDKINQHEFSKPCKWVYWNRGDRVSKVFKKSTAIRRIKWESQKHLQHQQ